MEAIAQWLADRALLENTLTSILLVFIVLVMRAFAMRAVRRADWSTEQTGLRWAAQVRWAALLLLLLGLVVIWATELRTLAFSVVAIAAAIVIATKELIMCISGSFVRATSRSFSLGDRIELDGVRGDVVGIGPMTTTVLEVGPGHRRTGRSVVLPNSLLLTKSVVNETFTDDFVLHVITLPLAADADWHNAEQRLLEAAHRACAPFLEEAREHMQASAEKHNVPVLHVNPTVSIQVPEGGKVTLVLRLPARGDQRSRLEQQVLREFLEVPASRQPQADEVAEPPPEPDPI